MPPDEVGLPAALRRIAAGPGPRVAALRKVADLLRKHGAYRWIGLYDVDAALGNVSIVVWSGPGPPEHPVFPVSKGLTGAAIARKETINVGNVAADPRYLTAFGSTRSEIIVPVFDNAGGVAGTIDIESENPGAFEPALQAFLEECAEAIRPLWKR